MKRIQEKHQQWFDSEINKLGSIDYHYMTTYDSEKFHCFIIKESNLPEPIASDIRVLFNELFNTQ